MSSIKILDWDSTLFGFPIATLNTDKLTTETWRLVADEVQKDKIRMLQYLCSCADLENIHQAENAGFHFIDTRLTYQKFLSTADKTPEKKDNIDFSIATVAHISQIINISKDLYQDFRFDVDKNFPRDKVNLLYQTWLSNAVHGTFDHLCYCLFIDKQPIGFCTIRYNDQQTASLGLFGIATAHQRKSLGNYLLKLVCADLLTKGYKEVRVVTQGRNIGAQRTYQGNGFKSLTVEMWYHQWFD